MISENIKLLRKKFNMTQEQLAEKVNVSRQAVTKWESGDAIPDIINVKEMAITFKVSIDALLGVEEKKITNDIERNLNLMIIILFIIGFIIFLGVMLAPHSEWIVENISPFQIICGSSILILPLIGIWIKDYVMSKKYIKEGNILKQREILLSMMPKDFLGRPLDIGSDKKSKLKRLKYSILDALFFAFIISILDIFNNSLVQVIKTFILITVILAFMNIKVLNFKIKKYNRLSTKND